MLVRVEVSALLTARGTGTDGVLSNNSLARLRRAERRFDDGVVDHEGERLGLVARGKGDDQKT